MNSFTKRLSDCSPFRCNRQMFSVMAGRIFSFLSVILLVSLLIPNLSFGQSGNFVKGYGMQDEAVSIEVADDGNFQKGYGMQGASGIIMAPADVPVNDLCQNALPVMCNSTVSGTTIEATYDNVGFCGTSNTSPGVWYYVTPATYSLVTVSTCNQANFDTKLTVFSGTCGAFVCVGGIDDKSGCTGFTSEVSFTAVAGTTYYILVHGFSSSVGNFNLTVTCETIIVPANDLCADAQNIGCNSTVSGTTRFSTFDNVGTCGTSNTSPGVWYKFEATGSKALLSTCNQANFDTKLSVFTGSCDALVCVDGEDDADGCSGFTTELEIPTVPGETYYILVHGFSSAVGNFDLTLSCNYVLVPVSDWAIVIAVFLIAVFVFLRFRKLL